MFFSAFYAQILSGLDLSQMQTDPTGFAEAYNRASMLDANNQAVRFKQNLINQLDTGISTAPAVAAAPAPKPAAAAPAAAAPVVAAAPVAAAPAPAAAPTSGAADNAAVNAALLAWAKAWSARDVNAYLATYAPDFVPEGGLSRATWEQQRRDRITRPSRIAVRASNPQLVPVGDDRVRVSFVQDYQSDTFSDQVNKVLEFKQVGGSYKIVREFIR